MTEPSREPGRAPGGTPLVSVIIPNHNYGRFVAEAIDSVLAQTYDNIEVIVVDNASTDDSLEVLRAYESRCTVLSQPRGGQSHARNLGMSHATGELVAFLDADDAWLPTKIEKQVQLLCADDDVVLVYCGIVETDESLRPGPAVRPHFRGQVLADFASQPGRAIVLGGESTAVVRRKALDEAGEFDPRLSISGGWDMWRRVACVGPVEFVDEPLMLYRQHGVNAHLRLPVYESDMRLANDKLFSDPAAVAVRPLRRRCVARTDLMFARAYFMAGDRGRAARLVARGIKEWPPVVGDLALALRWQPTGPSARPPLAHQVARRLGAAGVRGGRLYWGAAERLAPIPADVPVEVAPGVVLSFDPDDWIGSNAYRGLYERAEMALVRRLLRPGETVVDVGANIGYVSAIAARAVTPGGRVLAFEPSGRCLAHLRISAGAAPDHCITVFPHALGAADATAMLRGHQRPDHSGLGTLRRVADPSDGETVAIRSLDAVLAEEHVDTVDLLKVDVEGFEHDVLQGAAGLLDEGRVRFLLMEVSPEFGPTAFVAELLERLAAAYSAFAVGEAGAIVSRLRLTPTTPAEAAARTVQFNLLVARNDSLDRIAGLVH